MLSKRTKLIKHIAEISKPALAKSNYQKRFRNKQQFVDQVFSDVSTRYDLMNDLMSFGIQRYWKRIFIQKLLLTRKNHLLDLAGGTGDISKRYLNKGGKSAFVIDISKEMILQGRDDPKALMLRDKLNWTVGSMEALPLVENSFPLATSAFGVRNLSDSEAAFNEVFRVLEPNGMFFILEFSSNPQALVKPFYQKYSEAIIPFLGKVIIGDKTPYQYLVDSIRNFQSESSVCNSLRKVGFIHVKLSNLSQGIVSIFSAMKPYS